MKKDPEQLKLLKKSILQGPFCPHELNVLADWCEENAHPMAQRWRDRCAVGVAVSSFIKSSWNDRITRKERVHELPFGPVSFRCRLKQEGYQTLRLFYGKTFWNREFKLPASDAVAWKLTMEVEEVISRWRHVAAGYLDIWDTQERMRSVGGLAEAWNNRCHDWLAHTGEWLCDLGVPMVGVPVVKQHGWFLPYGERNYIAIAMDTGDCTLWTLDLINPADCRRHRHMVESKFSSDFAEPAVNVRGPVNFGQAGCPVLFYSQIANRIIGEAMDSLHSPQTLAYMAPLPPQNDSPDRWGPARRVFRSFPSVLS